MRILYEHRYVWKIVNDNHLAVVPKGILLRKCCIKSADSLWTCRWGTIVGNSLVVVPANMTKGIHLPQDLCPASDYVCVGGCVCVGCVCVFLTLTHFLFFFGKEEKDEWKKTEGGTEVMLSCPDFEPGTPRSPTTCPVCKPLRIGDGIATIP